MHKSKYVILPINVKCQAVGLPAHSRWVGLQQEAAQELNEGFLICKLVKLTNQSHAQLILLAANTITCREQKRYNTGIQQATLMLDLICCWFIIHNRALIYCRSKYIWTTIFVFLLVLLFALFTGRLALRGLRCSWLSSATRAASWKWWRSGAGQHLAATKGTGE